MGCDRYRPPRLAGPRRAFTFLVMTDRRISVRRAEAADRPEMLAITSEVWEGHDYVPRVWGDWLAEPQGYTQVAVLDGQVVGLEHVALRADNTGWIEGIRVAETARGKGVGDSLLADATDWARRMGLDAVALATSDENRAARRLAEKAGLRPIASFRSVAADAAPATAPLPKVRVSAPADVEEVWSFIQTRVPEHEGRHFYTEGWTVHQLTPSHLSSLLATFAVCSVGDRDTSALAAITAAPDRPNLRLGLLAGEESDLADLCMWLRDRALRAGAAGVHATVESTPGVDRALERAGFRSLWGNEMLLYERDLRE